MNREELEKEKEGRRRERMKKCNRIKERKDEGEKDEGNKG